VLDLPAVLTEEEYRRSQTEIELLERHYGWLRLRLVAPLSKATTCRGRHRELRAFLDGRGHDK
jgi:hypothetical protein